MKGNFIQYLDSHSNFWSVLFENPNDRDEAIRLLEERCTIERDEMEMSIKSNPNNNSNCSNDTIVVGSDANKDNNDESESHADAKNNPADEDATCDKAVETDPEGKWLDSLRKLLKIDLLMI